MVAKPSASSCLAITVPQKSVCARRAGHASIWCV